MTINRWEAGLKITGGAIVLEKSWVYLIQFQFEDNGKWSYINKEDVDYNFTVKNHRDEIQNMNTLSPHEGRGNLGVILAPDGNNKDAIEDLWKKTEKWRDYIMTGHLDCTEAWLALESTILKTIQYPMLALTLTEEECNYIMAPVLQVALPKTAISQNFLRKTLYAPVEEGGLGKQNLYTYQGTSQISLLHDHLALNTMTGELL